MPMFRKFYLLILVFACHLSLSAQQPPLIANTYNDIFLGDFMATGGGCAPDPDYNITVEPTLVPYANGVTLVAVITGLNTTQPNSTYTSYGLLNVGDTLPFDTTLGYPIWLYSGGTIEFEYRAIGVPTEVGESYYCDLGIIATLGACNNNIILQPNSTPDCEVLPVNSIAEGLGQGWEIYPVPSHGPLRLNHEDGLTQWESVDLFDLQGRKLRHWEEAEEMSTSGLTVGVYFLKIQAMGEESIMRILVD